MNIEKPVINIQLNANGKLAYDNENYRAKHGQILTWGSEFPFTIQFRDKSPLDEGGNPHHENNKRMHGTVKKNAGPGTYTYACAVYANDRVYLDAACPAIIID
jgi:hypothetical protein